MRYSLATRISIAVVGVLLLALLSSIVAIVSANRFESFQTALVDENIASVRAAEELEIALLEQRGYVSSYILDGGDRNWLGKLEKTKGNFDFWLKAALQAARTAEEREILARLEELQESYAKKRVEVVELFDAGRATEAREVLLSDVVTLSDEAYQACEEFISTNQLIVEDTSKRVRRQVKGITIVATSVFGLTMGLGLALLWMFLGGVVAPLRRIASEVRTAAGDDVEEAESLPTDELRELGHYVQLLMTNVAETRSDLEHSRTQLAHADKLAAVGKLAASVAHEIRNPLTAIKMWLYSLRRNVGRDADAQHKFDVISEEIIRLEKIVQSFLEFSKPPKLNLTARPVADVVDDALELVMRQLEGRRIGVERRYADDLPYILADGEQIRQVLLNLVNNAVDAIAEGGEICVECRLSHRGGREMVAVQVADNGPGIPKHAQQRIFEPFYSTKEEGTGLGLCIAASIMARHNGLLELSSSTSEGTVWTVWLPTAVS